MVDDVRWTVTARAYSTWMLTWPRRLMLESPLSRRLYLCARAWVPGGSATGSGRQRDVRVRRDEAGVWVVADQRLAQWGQKAQYRHF